MMLKDKVALVTGAGSGIGRASAIRFAEEGAKVMVADVRTESAQNTVAEIGKAGGSAKSVAVDVRVGAEVEKMVEETVRIFGRLDILFNNAGVFVPKNVVDTTEQEWDWVVDVCMKGVFFGCKYAIPHMIKQGGGVIINTASGAGIEGVPNLGAYQAAKGGVVIMSKGIALDFAKHNIRCNTICPGVIETPIAENCNTIPAGASQMMWERTGIMHPLGRNGKPEEVAALATFLASDQAAFITGVAVPIDGGFNAGAYVPPIRG
ncbi:MAG TPA: SDR family NAD(P)-dependent oxidoreductase [Candidatus Binataceae bacterium]|nr:SDR family NAD(P)-dependent oxidoreductase [Candidatus Binataceae bacterium]